MTAFISTAVISLDPRLWREANTNTWLTDHVMMSLKKKVHFVFSFLREQRPNFKIYPIWNSVKAMIWYHMLYLYRKYHILRSTPVYDRSKNIGLSNAATIQGSLPYTRTYSRSSQYWGIRFCRVFFTSKYRAQSSTTVAVTGLSTGRVRCTRTGRWAESVGV